MMQLASLPHAILHVDCDAFFASVEQALNPELKGKPVITGKERGIAAAMSYEAKRMGVVRGMRIHEIKKVCPNCIILPSDYETYSLYSKRLYGILRRFTPDVEEYSIDEAFCEITGLRRVHHTSYEEIARQMKDTLQRELGLTVSVGLSVTKSLAKLASKHQKPDGFTVVKGYQIEEFLKNMPTPKVCGFGPSTVALLQKHGINTVLEYIQRPEWFTKKLLGKVGVELWHELRGTKTYPIVMEVKNQVSLGKVKTFTPPSKNKEFVKAQLLRNLESAFIRLRRHKLATKEIYITLRNQEFRSSGIGTELTRRTSATQEVIPVVSALFEEVFKPNDLYRQSGVILCNLEAETEFQQDLFFDPCRIQSWKSLSECTDKINRLFGKHAIHLGSTHCLAQFSQHLGARGDHALRKKNLLKGETFRQRLALPVWNLKLS